MLVILKPRWGKAVAGLCASGYSESMRQRRRYPPVSGRLKMRVWTALRELASARGLSVQALLRLAAERALETLPPTAVAASGAAAVWQAMQRILRQGGSDSPASQTAATVARGPLRPVPRPSFSR